jgi:hypothetical protein
MRTRILIQILGHCLAAALALVLLLAWAALDAYGLGNLRHTPWAIPAVLIMGLLFWKLSAGILVALALLIVLLPSAARAKWSFHATPRYLGMGIALLTLSILPAIALVNWVPKFEGLGIELTSFFFRWGLAAIMVFGGWAILLDFVRRETVPAASPSQVG